MGDMMKQCVLLVLGCALVASRRGAFLSTSGSFTLSSGANRAGNDEEELGELDHAEYHLDEDVEDLGEDSMRSVAPPNVQNDIFEYLASMREEQKQCPRQSLRCPGSKSISRKASKKKGSRALVDARKHCENHDQLSGPSYPGLKLSDGSPAAADWFKPYMAEELAPELKRLGCNPASCAKQPLACKIPVCQGFETHDPKVKVGSPAKIIFKSANLYPATAWSGGLGCRWNCSHAMKQMRDVDSSSFTNAPKGMLFVLGFAGSRRGWYYPGEPWAIPYFSDKCIPAAYKGVKSVGSWMTPDVRFCNPNQMTSCHKASFVHSGITPYSKPGCGNVCGQRITGLVLKTTVCFGAKCYVHKQGVCMRMNHYVWHEWVDQNGPAQLKSVINAWKKGQYTTCKKWARKVINQKIALF